MKLRERVRQFKRSFHLRIFLALTLIIGLFIPGTGYLGYLQALHIAENQMVQYASGAAHYITKRVESFLSQHSDNVKLLASFIERGYLRPADEKEFLDYLHLFQQDRPEFANIYYGKENGDFFMVPPQKPEIYKIFDPRTRPWYRGAVSSGTTFWTDVYKFASTQTPGITVSVPIYNAEKKLMGVCGIDLDLLTFSSFLKSMDLGHQGVAYIFGNISGLIIGHPELAEPWHELTGLPLLRASFAQFNADSSNFSIITHEGEQFFTAFAPYPENDWTVGVTIPTYDYFKKVHLIKMTTICLVVVGILLSSILSYLLTKNIVRPLLHLQQGIDRIGRGDLSHRVVIEDPDIAADLSQSFNRMTLSLKNSLEELKVTYAELQEKEKLAAVGKMTAGIAHELKNPLGIILGSTQVFLDKNRPWEMREKAASFIKDEVVRLDTTLQAFLSFAKPAQPVFKEVDILALLTDILSAIRERYQDEGYEITTDLPGSVPLFEADPGQIRQIIMNVLINSMQAMPEGGTIKICLLVENDPESLKIKKRFISVRNPFTVARDWLIISITDEGCGIAEENLARIMDPFVSYRDEGVGLGLSIVSQLVKLHRGHIHIESKEGLGTTFFLYFPCILEELPINDQSAPR